MNVGSIANWPGNGTESLNYSGLIVRLKNPTSSVAEKWCTIDPNLNDGFVFGIASLAFQQKYKVTVTIDSWDKQTPVIKYHCCPVNF